MSRRHRLRSTLRLSGAIVAQDASRRSIPARARSKRRASCWLPRRRSPGSRPRSPTATDPRDRPDAPVGHDLRKEGRLGLGVSELDDVNGTTDEPRELRAEVDNALEARVAQIDAAHRHRSPACPTPVDGRAEQQREADVLLRPQSFAQRGEQPPRSTNVLSSLSGSLQSFSAVGLLPCSASTGLPHAATSRSLSSPPHQLAAPVPSCVRRSEHNHVVRKG